MKNKFRLAMKNIKETAGIAVEEKSLERYCSTHFHDFYELDIILDGEGVSVCNGEEFSLRRGMMTFVTPEDLHSYSVRRPMNEINIQFSHDAVDPHILSHFTNSPKRVVYIDEDTVRRIYSIFVLLDDCEKSGENKDYLSRLLECILLSVKRYYYSGEIIGHRHFPQSLQKALVYIHSNFKDDPKMSKVAEYVYLNENYFCSMFKEQMGESYKEYLRQLKLAHAKKLVMYTDLPITKIAYDSGYNAQSHFNREFLKKYGISPMKMRKENETETETE